MYQTYFRFSKTLFLVPLRLLDIERARSQIHTCSRVAVSLETRRCGGKR